MPWWAEGCEETRKMIISYDNLITRLWLSGAIRPYNDDDDLLDEQGLPPIPHPYWVQRLGFQQEDPVTDFRSGGVLSLALMVHVVESCPQTFARFVRPNGDACVLPFGITSINITDMMAKFLMLAKNVDRMDALLSQKPFWKMFADPNALTVSQELCCDILADVVVELQMERAFLDQPHVTVFDFSFILERTEQRVQYDLLGAGPKTVSELYAVHSRLKSKYQKLLQQRLNPQPHDDVRDTVKKTATEWATGATSLAGSVMSKIKTPGFNPLSRVSVDSVTASDVAPEAENHAHLGDAKAGAVSGDVTTSEQQPAQPDLLTAHHETSPNPVAVANEDDNDWAKVLATTDAVGNFCIGSHEDDDDDL